MVPLDTKKRVARNRRTKNRAKGIINELYSPIDATNRFINLALQSIGENSQERQFLLESKEGIRKTSLLLKKLNNYMKEL